MNKKSTEQKQQQAYSKKNVTSNYKGHQKPKLEDFYDTNDPRGCSTSEYEDYRKAVVKWERDNNYA